MFSTTTEYALRAMAWLAAMDGELVPTNMLAAKTQVPQNYLAKVLQSLASSKLVVGQRGVRGGYKLARPPEEITLLEVARCVSPVAREAHCPLGAGRQHKPLCPLHKVKDRATAAVIDVLGSVTLRDVVRDSAGHLCEGAAHARAAAG